MSKVQFVVVYDVVNDRRRVRLARTLKGYLEHVQKSVFEGPLEERRIEQLQRAVSRIVRRDVDSVRYYSLCRRCREATEIVGTGVRVEEDTDDIVI